MEFCFSHFLFLISSPFRERLLVLLLAPFRETSLWDNFWQSGLPLHHKEEESALILWSSAPKLRGIVSTGARFSITEQISSAKPHQASATFTHTFPLNPMSTKPLIRNILRLFKLEIIRNSSEKKKLTRLKELLSEHIPRKEVKFSKEMTNWRQLTPSQCWRIISRGNLQEVVLPCGLGS